MEQQQCNSLLDLPQQVLPLIITQLHIKDAVSLSQTCQRLRRLTLDLPGDASVPPQKRQVTPPPSITNTRRSL